LVPHINFNILCVCVCVCVLFMCVYMYGLFVSKMVVFSFVCTEGVTSNYSSYIFILLPSGLISRDRIGIRVKFVITVPLGAADNISTGTSW
jgi:hypothetical protein